MPVHLLYLLLLAFLLCTSPYQQDSSAAYEHSPSPSASSSSPDEELAVDLLLELKSRAACSATTLHLYCSAHFLHLLLDHRLRRIRIFTVRFKPFEAWSILVRQILPAMSFLKPSALFHFLIMCSSFFHEFLRSLWSSVVDRVARRRSTLRWWPSREALKRFLVMAFVWSFLIFVEIRCIQSSSMYPALCVGDRIIAEKVVLLMPRFMFWWYDGPLRNVTVFAPWRAGLLGNCYRFRSWMRAQWGPPGGGMTRAKLGWEPPNLRSNGYMAIKIDGKKQSWWVSNCVWW